MNIFVAGIHGVGKTYLASRVAPDVGMVHTSASNLIKEERALTTWTNDKRVADVDANQRALAAAVQRYNKLGTRLLLDGHFVLLNTEGEMTRLETRVFSTLNLDRVILIETGSQILAQRIKERDDRKISLDHILEFMKAEHDHAENVCTELEIPLVILVTPSPEEFAVAVSGSNNFE